VQPVTTSSRTVAFRRGDWTAVCRDVAPGGLEDGRRTQCELEAAVRGSGTEKSPNRLDEARGQVAGTVHGHDAGSGCAEWGSPPVHRRVRAR